MSGRPWLPSEDAMLRTTLELPSRVVAGQIGRTERAVHIRRRFLGLRKQRYTVITTGHIQQIRDLNAQHYTDQEIADTLGLDKGCVNMRRRRMGLPSRAFGPRHIESIRRMSRDQCRENDVRSLAELKQLRRRVDAVKRGWPPECTPLMCDVLDQIETSPRTRRELCGLLGKTYHRCKSLTTTGGVSVMASLIRMGAVVRLGRRPYGDGRGKTSYVYGLAPGFARSRKAGTA